MTVVFIVLSTLFYLIPSDASAQTDSIAPGSMDSAPVVELDLALQDSTAAWTEALNDTPALVALRAEIPSDPIMATQARLTGLSDKTFSNREWKGYWQRQVDTVTAMQQALNEPTSLRGRGLTAWITLADDKLENQDVYLTAIAVERDAQEGRLEMLREASAEREGSPVQTVLRNDDSAHSPFSERQERLRDLKDELRLQQSKRLSTQREIAVNQKLLDSEQSMLSALQNDLHLAQREHAIALEQSRAPIDEFTPIWEMILQSASAKTTALDAEVQHGQSRQRARQVALELSTSQVEFRDRRIETINTEYDSESGLENALITIRDTGLLWLKERAWRILIGLIVIFLGMKLVLRGIERGQQFALRYAHGDPNTTEDDDNRTKTLTSVAVGVSRIAVFAIASLLALEQIGVNTGPILGSVAILGLAVSFGSQNLVKDMVNGLFILLEDQFEVGDVVTVSGQTGTVDRITIRSTWIRAYSGDVYVVPNGEISVVTNLTRGWSRAVCDIGVGYTSDLDQVKQIINDVGTQLQQEEQWAAVLEEAPCWVGVTALGDSAITVRCHAKVKAGNQWGVGRELNQRLKVAFDAAGIDIPFPQVVVHNAG